MALSIQERAFIAAAQQGNDSCFEEIYKNYYNKAYALAVATVKNPVNAPEIMQAAFIKVWNNLARLNKASGFDIYLFKTVLDESYSFLSRKSGNAGVSLEDEATEVEIAVAEDEGEFMVPEHYAERAELSEKFEKALEGLTTVQRQAITLYYFCDLTVEETAQIMGGGEGAVKSRLYLARTAVLTRIKEFERNAGLHLTGSDSVPSITFGEYIKARVMRNGLPGGQAKQCFINIYSAHMAQNQPSVMQAPMPNAQNMSAVTPKKKTPASTKALIAVLITAVVLCIAAAAIFIPMLLNKDSSSKQKQQTVPTTAAVKENAAKKRETAPAKTQPPQTKAAVTNPPTQAPTQPPTEAPTEAPTAPDIRQNIYEAYTSALSNTADSVYVRGYYVHDLDGDGLVELLIDVGEAQLQRRCYVYTYNELTDSADEAGYTSLSDGGFILTDAGDLVSTGGRSGVYFYNRITMQNKRVVSESLFSDHGDHTEELGGYRLTPTPSSDLEPLKNSIFGT